MNLEQRLNIEMKKVTDEYRWELEIIQPEDGLTNIIGFKEKAEWAINHLNPQIHISFGNNKLPKTTCIINLGTWFNCSGRKEGFCELCQCCYDKSPEVRFKDRTLGRLEQEIFWRACTAQEFAKAVINQIKLRNTCTKMYKVKQIRWCEVGELRNQEDLEKMIEVSNIIFDELGIKSYVYTHNKSLDFNQERPNLTINGSNFMIDNEYRVIPKNQKVEEKHFDCDCDCKVCNICAGKHGIIIVEELRK